MSPDINRSKSNFEAQNSRSIGDREQKKDTGNVGGQIVQQTLGSSFITNFFNIAPSKPIAKNNTVTHHPDSIFKKGLGSKPQYSNWNQDQEKIFNKSVKPKARNSKVQPLNQLKTDLISRSVKAQLNYKQNLKTKIVDERDPKAHQRFVVLKFEDHLFYSYGFSGRFGKHSAVLGGRRPFGRDAEVIDYDLDSDEDLEDMNGESIHSDDKDEDDDEDEEAADDGFVVADGYFSDEELGGSVDAEERSRSGIKLRKYG